MIFYITDRHLDQVNYFLKQNPGEPNLTLDGQTACNSAYCLWKSNDRTQYYRFGFPFKYCEKSDINFE